MLIFWALRKRIWIKDIQLFSYKKSYNKIWLLVSRQITLNFKEKSALSMHQLNYHKDYTIGSPFEEKSQNLQSITPITPNLW